jgi:hypothetical protein
VFPFICLLCEDRSIVCRIEEAADKWGFVEKSGIESRIDSASLRLLNARSSFHAVGSTDSVRDCTMSDMNELTSVCESTRLRWK